MDLPAVVAEDLGLDLPRARALVGGVLGVIAEELCDRHGLEAERALDAEVPEMSGWRVEALRWLGHAGRERYGPARLAPEVAEVLNGGAHGAAAEGALLNAMIDVLAPELRAFDPDPRQRARMAIERVNRFLHHRLSPTLYAQALDASPLLRRVANGGRAE